jgi:hypothetical protein
LLLDRESPLNFPEKVDFKVGVVAGVVVAEGVVVEGVVIGDGGVGGLSEHPVSPRPIINKNARTDHFFIASSFVQPVK